MLERSPQSLTTAAISASTYFSFAAVNLITSILIAEYKRTGRIDLRRFYVRRARRIFPAYYVYLTIVGALALIGAEIVRDLETVTTSTCRQSATNSG